MAESKTMLDAKKQTREDVIRSINTATMKEENKQKRLKLLFDLSIFHAEKLVGVHRKSYHLANHLLVEMQKAGILFFNDSSQRYLFNPFSKTIIDIPLKHGTISKFWSFLHTLGVGLNEEIAKHLWAACAALSDNRQLQAHRLSYYDKQNNTLYITNHDGTVWKLMGKDGIVRIPNGAEIFFMDDLSVVPCQPDIKNHNIFNAFVTDANFSSACEISPTSQRFLLLSWFYAVMFPQLFRLKPIVLLDGDMGAGKTFTITRFQKILYGEEHATTAPKDEESLAVSLLRTPIALLDNLDSYIQWLPNFIAAYTSGASYTGRKRFTDTGKNVIPARSFLTVTSRDPKSFRRSDVADRCLVFHFDRRENFTPTKVENYLFANREKLLGEYLWTCNEIVKALTNPLETASKYRTSEFANFCVLMAPIVGEKLKIAEVALAEAQTERLKLSVEEDFIVAYVEEWLRNPKNIGLPVTARQLHKEFQSLIVLGHPYKIKSPITLGRAINALKDGFKTIGIDCTTAKDYTNTSVYSFLHILDSTLTKDYTV